jgi:hypothetical protein
MKAAAKAPNLGQSFAHLLLQVARHRVDFLPSIRIGTMLCAHPQVLKLIFVPKLSSTRAAASSSAVFLIAFLLVHVGGNILIFKGRDAFNECVTPQGLLGGACAAVRARWGVGAGDAVADMDTRCEPTPFSL